MWTGTMPCLYFLLQIGCVMKILFVCSANVWGGNEKWTSMAMAELEKSHKVFLCYKNELLSDKFHTNSLKLKVPLRNYLDIVTFYKLFLFVKKHNIDVIIPTKKKEYFICGIIAKLSGIKNVLRLGSVRNLDKPVWHNIVYGKLNHGIIVNAHRIKQNLLRYKFMRAKRIKVIYNGIVQTDIKKCTKPKDTFTITSSGRLTKLKGFHLLIKAVSELPMGIKQKIQVKIIGEGPFLQELQELAEQLHVATIISFTGFIDEPQRIISESDLFVLLSFNEGLSNSLLEAMINGIPVFTTDVGGVREFIKNSVNGFITDSRDPTDIAAALENIIQNKSKLHKIGQKGRNIVKELFSMDKMGSEINNFLKTVVTERTNNE